MKIQKRGMHDDKMGYLKFINGKSFFVNGMKHEDARYCGLDLADNKSLSVVAR